MKLRYLSPVALCLTFFILSNTHAQTTKRITAGMNLQNELNNATSGDIFLVEAGYYGDIVIGKRIFLYGTGYFLTGGTQASPGTSKIGKVYFKTGAESSSLQGFETENIEIGASNILIARNYCKLIRVGINEAGNTWDQTANGVIIKQNFAQSLQVFGSNGGTCLNFSIKNNIWASGFFLVQNISGEIINNTFNADNSGNEPYYSYQSYLNPNVCGKLNIQMKNNIMTSIGSSNLHVCQIVSYLPDIFNNNILNASDSWFSTVINNTVLTDLNTLYVGYPNNPNNLNPDARNQLAANSPAKGAGEGGTDAGAFGGDEPYILSGLPPIPSIYQLTVPANVPQNGTLNVTIKAKTNN